MMLILPAVLFVLQAQAEMDKSNEATEPTAPPAEGTTPPPVGPTPVE